MFNFNFLHAAVNKRLNYKSSKIFLEINKLVGYGKNFIPIALKLFKVKALGMISDVYFQKILSPWTNANKVLKINSTYLLLNFQCHHHIRARLHLIWGPGNIMSVKILSKTNHLGNLIGTTHSIWEERLVVTWKKCCSICGAATKKMRSIYFPKHQKAR